MKASTSTGMNSVSSPTACRLRTSSCTLEEKSSSDERFRRLVELAPDAVLMCADTRIRSANPAAIALAGAENRNDVIASTIDRFLSFDDRNTDPTRSGGLRLATWTQLDGSELHVEVAEIADLIGGELVRQFVVRDVTHSRLREADLAHRAEHDSLTGLVNRARFESRLRELLLPGGLTPVRDVQEVAVMFIDLDDDFKPVNDTYGHAAGDAVLVTVAARLRDSTRGTDLIARLGGDEFAVLLEGPRFRRVDRRGARESFAHSISHVRWKGPSFRFEPASGSRAPAQSKTPACTIRLSGR